MARDKVGLRFQEETTSEQRIHREFERETRSGLIGRPRQRIEGASPCMFGIKVATERVIMGAEFLFCSRWRHCSAFAHCICTYVMSTTSREPKKLQALCLAKKEKKNMGKKKRKEEGENKATDTMPGFT